MKLTKISIKSIKPYKDNPRYNEDAISYVKKSIEDYGYLNPIIVNNDNVIICGHTRYEALKQLGKKEIEVIKIDDLSPELEKAFRIVDNKVSEYSYWDNEKLQRELAKTVENALSIYNFEYNNLEDIDIDENDFISDEEKTKKQIICPYCGEEIE